MNERVFLELVEGKPAPMPLLAVQAFANTLDVEEGTDKLSDPESFRAWLRETGLVKPGFRLGTRGLAATRRLRDSLRDALAANATGKLDPRAGRRLAEQAGNLRVHLQSDADGNLGLDLSPAEDLGELGALLLGIVFRSQVDGSWERLKLCQNPDCLWAFYDSSRNRSGAWCRMGECGNRLKNRAYRRRQRSG
jgi:predicted RNA-binding Zn ribbon-like protein